MNRTLAFRGFQGVVAMVALAIAVGACAAQAGAASAPSAAALVAAAGPATASGASDPSPAAGAVPLAATCTPGASACPIRISFAPGAYSGQGHSTLTGISSERWFVVNARAGQTMIVIVKGAGATRGIVHFPNGTSSGQPGGRVFDDVLPVSGDYRIQVNESPMGEAWSGGVDVVVVIY